MGYGCFFSCLLILYSLFVCFFIVSQSIRILLGLAAGSERTLPHVLKYQTVIPQRLKDTSLTSDAAATQVMPCLFLFLGFFNALPPPFFFFLKTFVKNALTSLLLSVSVCFFVCLDVSRCSAVLFDNCRAKPHAAPGEEQVRELEMSFTIRTAPADLFVQILHILS